MQIVICDDLKEERTALREHIHSFSLTAGLDYVIEEYENSESLLAAVKQDKRYPDIVFMDIYMSGMTGMEAAKELMTDGFSGAIIFTTTSESHAIESYKLMADGYLLKPYTQEEFNLNFERVMRSYTESFKTVSFPHDRLEFRVFQKDLEFVEAAARGSLLHAKGETVRTTKSLTEFASELLQEEYFLQCHRGCIVNLNFVKKVETDHVLMKNGEKAPLAMQSRQAFKKAVSDYFFLKMRED